MAVGSAWGSSSDGPTVAERMLEYADLGIESFILSGYPHLEEAYQVAELLFPLLPINPDQASSLKKDAHSAENFVGNEFRPIR